MCIGAIIQARLSSTRLPKKIMRIMPNGFTVIEYIIKRLQKIKLLEKIIVAIPEKEIELAFFLEKKGIAFCFGHEQDVLLRFYKTMKVFNLDVLLRVTADDPFRDPNIERIVIEKLVKETYLDYVKTIGLPEGINAEVIRGRALEKACKEAKLPSEREHVTPYIYNNPQIFNCLTLEFPNKQKDVRLTLDRIEDWQVVKKIDQYFKKNKKMFYSIDDIQSFLNLNPEIKKINNHIVYNEGYLQSLEQERKEGQKNE